MQSLQEKASEWSGVSQNDAFEIDNTNLFQKLGLQTFINLSTNFYTRFFTNNYTIVCFLNCFNLTSVWLMGGSRKMGENFLSCIILVILFKEMFLIFHFYFLSFCFNLRSVWLLRKCVKKGGSLLSLMIYVVLVHGCWRRLIRYFWLVGSRQWKEKCKFSSS